MKARQSISVVLTGISMAGMLAVTVAVSGIFVVNMQKLTAASIETDIRDKTEIIADNLMQSFRSYDLALYQAAAGISALHDRAGSSSINYDAIPAEEMRAYLLRVKGTMKEAAQIFMANNTPTFENGGYAVFAPRWDFGGNYDQRTRPWFTGAKNKPGAISYSDPYMAMATGIFSTSLSTIIYDSKNKDLGVLVLDIAVSSLTNMVKVNMDGMEAWLLNKKGIYISNKDESKVMKADFFEDKKLERYRAKVLSSETFFAMDDEDIICSYAIPGVEWVVVSVIPKDIVFAEVNNVIRDTALIALGVMFVLLVILVLAVRGISKPIVGMVRILKDISEGEGDLTRTISVSSKNEIGELATYFNKLISAIRVPISETKAVIDELASSSKELTAVSQQLSVSSGETVQQASQMINRTEMAATNINAIASSSEQASASANEVAGAAEQMSMNMNTIAAAIEEMSASISEISSNASETRHIANEASEKSEGATRVMNELGTAAKEIGHVTDVIKKIADKTNLLALNATIEAASAGNAGKGFAVVAGEIKELANQSAKSADDIARRIQGIQDSTGGAVVAIRDVSDIIEKINASVEAISVHVGEQTKASNEIANNVAQANSGARKVASSIGEIAKGGNEIAQHSGDAARRMGKITDNANAMNKAAQESNKGSLQVSSSADSLAKMASNLHTVMGKFKV